MSLSQARSSAWVGDQQLGQLGSRGRHQPSLRTNAQNSLPSGSARTCQEMTSSGARSTVGAMVDQPLHVVDLDVDVDAVLGRLGLGHLGEDDALERHHRELVEPGPALLLVAAALAPEHAVPPLRDRERVGAVDDDLVELVRRHLVPGEHAELAALGVAQDVPPERLECRAASRRARAPRRCSAACTSRCTRCLTVTGSGTLLTHTACCGVGPSSRTSPSSRGVSPRPRVGAQKSPRATGSTASMQRSLNVAMATHPT